MVQIFAARDATGATRFIGEVPRGASCGCFCLVCGSPLVARQGEVNEPHFAHEGGQERPDCLVGALNLLRRLVVEELARMPWRIADYEANVPAAGALPVRWTDVPLEPVQSLANTGGPRMPAATVELKRGGTGHIYVLLGREKAPTDLQQPSVEVSVPMPHPGALRTEETARGYVRAHLQMRWLYLPDYDGLVEAAAHRQRKAMREKLQALRGGYAGRDDPGRRWAEIRRQSTPPSAAFAGSPSPSSATPSSSADLSQRPLVRWAPGLAGSGAIQYRQLRDGSQWVVYPAGTEWRIAPVPEPFDGWVEFFPPSVAIVEGDGWLRVVSQTALVTFLARLLAASHIDSDPAVIERQFKAAAA